MKGHAGFHLQAQWLYGVVVGLSIREALNLVVPVLTNPNSSIPRWAVLLMITRLAGFMVMQIRLYLGSVAYFSEVYIDETTSHLYTSKSYGLDFLIGLVHFLFLFAWATTLNDYQHREANGVSHYLTLGSIVLLYDVVWWFVNYRYDSSKCMQLWTLVNVTTFVVCVAIFFGTGFDVVFREQACISVLAILSLIDIAEIIGDRRVIANWLERVLVRATPN